jgi:hypothetical protein
MVLLGRRGKEKK